MKTIDVAGRRIGPGESPFVIAEIGVNFDNIDTAIAMVRSAGELGCDAVKLQTFRAETLS